MEISVLASGSKGNVSYITSSSTKLLIDLGLTLSNIEKKLEEIGINPSEINGILLTHTHTDHTSSLKNFIKKYNTKLYLSEKMYNELSKTINLFNYEIIDKEFIINDINIQVIKLSHDTDDSNGYILESNNKSIVYITDTGYINKKYFKLLTDKDIYVMESNHDIEMLMNGNRPYFLKQRILGDKGHLDNTKSSNYLAQLIGPNTKEVILIHLSEDNNTPELALNTLKETLLKNKIYFNNIIISSQKERTDLVKI